MEDSIAESLNENDIEYRKVESPSEEGKENTIFVKGHYTKNDLIKLAESL